MGMGSFISKLHAKSSDKGSIDPHSTKMAMIQNTPTVTMTEKAVEHVNAPVSVTVTVQAKVDPSSPSHGQTRSGLGEQRRTSTPILEQMDKFPLATDKEVKDYGVTNNTHDKPKTPIRDHSSRAIVEDYKVIKNKLDKPLATAPDQKYSSPIKQRIYGVINGDKRDIPSIPVHNPTYNSPRKSYGVIEEKHDKPSNLVHDQGYKFPSTKVDKAKHYGSVENKGVYTSSPVQELPKKAEEFASGQPAKPSLLGAKNWRNEYGGEYTNYNYKDLDKPSNGNVKYKQVIEPYGFGGENRHGMDGVNAYGEYANYRNEDFDKPSNGNFRCEQVIDSYEVGGENRHGIDGANVYGEYTNYRNKDLEKPRNDIVRYKQVVGPHEVGKNSEIGGGKWRDTDGADVYGEYANYRYKDMDKPRYDIVRYKQIVGPLEVGKSSEIGGKKWRDTDGADVYGEYANYQYKDMDKPRYDIIRYKQVVGPHEVGKSSEIGGKIWRYGEYTNYSNNYLDMPSNDIVRYRQVVDPYKSRWGWPSNEEWAIPPTQMTPLFGPTNDIGKAVEFLKEAVISAPQPQYNNCCTDSRSPFRNAYSGALDSNEAQRRFGNPNPSARPSYTGTISSTEAARKYGGTPA